MDVKELLLLVRDYWLYRLLASSRLVIHLASCALADVRPSVETRLPRLRRSLLSGTIYNIRIRADGERGWVENRTSGPLYATSAIRSLRSFGRIPPWEKLDGTPRPCIRWIQSSSSPGLQSRAGQVQHNSGDYAIIFKKFLLRSTSRLYLRIVYSV